VPRPCLHPHARRRDQPADVPVPTRTPPALLQDRRCRRPPFHSGALSSGA
jgi:hypothetical protein